MRPHYLFHVVYGVLIFKALSHAFSIFRRAWQHYIYKDILVITKSALKQTKRNSFLIVVEDLTEIWSVAGKHIHFYRKLKTLQFRTWQT